MRRPSSPSFVDGWLGSSGDLSLRALGVGIVASLSLVLVVTWYAWSVWQLFERVSTEGVRLERVIGSIVHLDEVLTMSARMAAATGDPHWEERYRSFEPTLDATIQEAIRLAPAATAAAAAKTDSANQALVARENRAFELVRQGRRTEAAAELFSPVYEDHKRVYASGMESLSRAIQARAQSAQEDARQRALQAGAFAVLSMGLLVVAWAGLAGMIRRHLAERDRAEVEHRRVESRVQHSQKLESLGVLAAGIAHEINNPLAYVRANTEHLFRLAEVVRTNLEAFDASQAKEVAEIEEVIQDSLDGLARIAAIVESTRRFSRTSDRGYQLFSPNRMIEEAIRLFSLHEHRGSTIVTELAPGLPPLNGAVEQMHQVLMSLFINAEQALEGSENPRIRIESRRNDEWLEIRVQDSGPGIAPEIRGAIFDPFFTTKGPDQGTGLGLSIAHDILRDHQGTIELENSPLGGACFVVRLPLPAQASG